MTTDTDQFPIAIVGAGFAGLGMAVELQNAGIDSFTIYEAASEVGGTWRENTYPGCACDIPSHLYSFSFELNPHWSRAYSPQPEIQRYLVDCAQQYDLYSKIQFETRIERAEFDEERGLWTLVDGVGDQFTARALVLGVGGLREPNIPNIQGLNDFEGPHFHSARWDHDVDLQGKRVGVVGTGASGVQIVPAIADEVDELTVFQRTPPWVLPRNDRQYTFLEKALFSAVPGLQRAYRAMLYWFHEARGAGFVSAPRLMELFQTFGRRFIEHSFDDPQLRQKVTPDYTMGCKRVLFSDDYYRTLARDDVHLVDRAVDRFRADSVVDAGGDEHQLDAVVFATGFQIHDFLSHIDISGRDGRNLNEEWSDGSEAYFGVAVHGFPNLFMLIGPNSGLGHNSIVFMIEAQTHLIRQALQTIADEGATSMEVRPAAQRNFNRSVQQRMGDTVWKSGCDSWYLDDDGTNRTLWPGYTAEYWLRTRNLNRDDFRLTWR